MTVKKTSPNRAFALLWFSSVALCGVFTQPVPDESNANSATPLIRLAVMAVILGIALCCKRESLDLGLLRVSRRRDTAYAVASGAMLAGAMVFFYKAWKFAPVLSTAPATAMAAALGLKPRYLMLGASGMLAMLAWPALYCLLREVLERTLDIHTNVLQEKRDLLKPILILAALYCFSIIAILRSDFIYKDDMQRLVWGNTIYSRESRFAAEYVTTFLHLDLFFTDISPLPQLLEMVIMAAAAVIVFSAVSRKAPGGYELFAMLPFALTPYFLEGVSFKYDSPQHACAVLFSVLPFLYCQKSRKQYLFLMLICTPLSCTFHQVPMCFPISVALVVALVSWSRGEWDGRRSLRFLLETAGAWILGLMIYRFGIFYPFSKTGMLDWKNLIPGVLKNYRSFFSYILSDFNLLWLGLIGLLCAGFVWQTTFRSVRRRGRALLLSVMTLAALILMSFGLYPLLAAPLYSPRHMYSFCLFVGLISMTAVSMGDKREVLMKLCSVVLGISFISFAFTYGNALTEQKYYTEYRVNMVMETLAEIASEAPEEGFTVKVTGSIGFAPPIKAMPETLNMVRRLVPTMFDEYYAGWSAIGMYEYYGLNLRAPDETRDPDDTELNLRLREENIYHSVYQDGAYILVHLNER